ncbi:hypothetical protein PybrP1_007152 [[Pythium] brassicae (nom. inval.)]|nr:hypothetical protein PybrP1_007152 [[Pythium] brassicae (nom. inval.)]
MLARRMNAVAAVDDDDYGDATVGYWRLRQPHRAAAPYEPPSDANTETCDADADDDSEYEVLAPSDESTHRLLDNSAFFAAHMPAAGDRASEALLAFCGSFPVRVGPLVAAALVRRFTTDVRFNWRTKTLQSFLEVAVWAGVTLATASLYRDDWLFAVEVGTFAGALMSVCDEVVLLALRGLARAIRNQHGGRELLEKLGFDVPASGKAPTDGRELALLKTLVFGYLGVVGIRALWANLHDAQAFALLAAAAGAAFVATAEFFCLWLPTRRVGLTLQSRFTTVRANWREHPVRSGVELACWAASTLCFYARSGDFVASLRLGTLVAVALCLSAGLDELPDIVSSDERSDAATPCAFWEARVDGDAYLSLAGALVAAQEAVTKRVAWVRRGALGLVGRQ